MKKNLFPVLTFIGIVLVLGAIAFFSNPDWSKPLPSPAPSPSPSPQNNTDKTATLEMWKSTSGHELVKNCTPEMATGMHIHQHLVVLVEKTPQTIPAGIGIDLGKQCLSPVHTHTDGGLIHVEAPVKVDFALGDFFYNWKTAFSKLQFGSYKVDKDHGLKMYVNGKESQDFENLVLQDHQEIVIDYYLLKDGPGSLPPPFNGWDKI